MQPDIALENLIKPSLDLEQALDWHILIVLNIESKGAARLGSRLTINGT